MPDWMIKADANTDDKNALSYNLYNCQALCTMPTKRLHFKQFSMAGCVALRASCRVWDSMLRIITLSSIMSAFPCISVVLTTCLKIPLSSPNSGC